MIVRIISDVHGKHSRFYDLCNQTDKVLQIGDFGFDYEILELFPEGHISIILGNHDNYNKIPKESLGDFGPIPFIPDSFFVRGAYSIDKAYRIEGVSWWREEELNNQQANECIEAYEKAKPKIVITHDAPEFICRQLPLMSGWGDYKPSFTQRLLQQLWEIHKPEQYYFAHWHCSWSKEIEGCSFQCLNELEYVDLEV